MNKCPVCEARIPTHKLMCWFHWDLVPRQLQVRVTHAWNDYLRADTPSARLATIAPLREAQDAAVAAVNTRLKGA